MLSASEAAVPAPAPPPPTLPNGKKGDLPAEKEGNLPAENKVTYQKKNSEICSKDAVLVTHVLGTTAADVATQKKRKPTGTKRGKPAIKDTVPITHVLEVRLYDGEYACRGRGQTAADHTDESGAVLYPRAVIEEILRSRSLELVTPASFTPSLPGTTPATGVSTIVLGLVNTTTERIHDLNNRFKHDRKFLEKDIAIRQLVRRFMEEKVLEMVRLLEMIKFLGDEDSNLVSFMSRKPAAAFLLLPEIDGLGDYIQWLGGAR
ncbi:hypothetical protein B0H66DRAFT_533835 [Apodospora peruviana]|uniref:Uncharacterized protein n=1 Tax=Apodospora peruviana TaxID=516989 RepID=A0AAE0I6Q7_9PEZI|nr:hypothetical protein B0H66DRAFT_533835 [Apodospora peruviana]